MSMGYMPKKVKNAKRQQRLRKKYKNFSCKTCKSCSLCGHKLGRTSYGIIVYRENVEFCPFWKAKKEEKPVEIQSKGKNRKSKKTIFKKFFNT